MICRHSGADVIESTDAFQDRSMRLDFCLVDRDRSPCGIPLIGAVVKRFFMRAGIVSVTAGVAILGGTVTQAMAAPVNAIAGSSATSSTTVVREYGGVAFTPDEALQSARANLAQGSINLRITCTERSILVRPLDNSAYREFGDWLGIVTADCSG
jgi:hypothetical protein